MKAPCYHTRIYHLYYCFSPTLTTTSTITASTPTTATTGITLTLSLTATATTSAESRNSVGGTSKARVLESVEMVRTRYDPYHVCLCVC